MFQLPQRMTGLPPNLQGAVWMVLGAFAWSANLVLVKLLSTEYSPAMLAFLRAFAGFLFIVPIILRQGPQLWQLNRKGLMLVRGVVAGGAVMLSYYSASNLPLSQFNAIVFSKPLFIMALAVVFLGERLGVRRIVAACIGFIGVLLIVQPGGEVSPAVWLAIGTAISAGFVNIFGKILTRTNSVVTILVYSNLLMALFTFPFALQFWTTPQLGDIGLLAAMVLTGTAAQALFVKSVSVGEASFVANFEFFRLPLTAVADRLIFSITPPLMIWPGAILIIGSVAYISWREAQLKAKGQTRSDTSPIDSL